MPKIFPIFKRVVAGGPVDCPDPLVDSFSIELQSADSNPALTDAGTFVLNAEYPETVPAETDALTNLSLSGLGDTVDPMTEGREADVISWATGCIDNDSSQTVPANANGQPNATVATVKTNNSLGDLTNPVILTTGSLNWFGGAIVPGTLKLVVHFNIGTAVVPTDTITISITDGTTTVTLYTWAGAAENNLAVGREFTLDETVLNESLLVVTASYTATVVALPQTSLQIDAIGLKARVTI